MNDQTTATIRHTIGASGSFVLRTVAGSVHIEGTDGEEAVVTATSGDGHSGAPSLSVQRSPNGLRIEPERRTGGILGGSLGRVGVPSVDFHVLLPRSARVEVNAVSADVSGRELHGDQSYREVSGDLSLEDVSGRISVTSVSGDVRLLASEPAEINATTTSGDLEISAHRLDLLRARSVSGDVALSGQLSAGPEHRIETVSGDLRLHPVGGVTVETSGPAVALRSELSRLAGKMPDRGSVVVGDGAARLKFRSLSGDVNVRDAEPAEAVRATTPAEAPRAEPPVPQPRAGGETSLDVLRALERGEIDVEEASRLLEVADRG
jgi:hypothetical protein